MKAIEAFLSYEILISCNILMNIQVARKMEVSGKKRLNKFFRNWNFLLQI